ncbi:MAG TPA: OmpH family outer membrane protein [Bacteroidia bacterium]|nr:OmpH family outer membrane protein [Bacteroidia bacterium]
MRNSIIVVIIAVVLSVGGSYFWYSKQKLSRLAYVRSQVVLDKYKGMEEAKARYQKKIDEWQANYDSLELNYNMMLQDYDNPQFVGNRKELEIKLARQQQIVKNYADDLEIKAGQENEKLTQGVLNQINEYIKQYAISKEYDLVLGVTLSGNILYGSEAMDITDEIVQGINLEYSGK